MVIPIHSSVTNPTPYSHVAASCAENGRPDGLGRGVWLLAGGGIGSGAARVVRKLHSADDRPFPLVIHQIETDDRSDAQADVATSIALDEQELAVIRSNPLQFGSEVPRLLQTLKPYLEKGDPSPGARTIRPFAQLFWSYCCRNKLIDDARQALTLLAKSSRIATVLPLIVASSGGGTGSSISVLLPRALRDPEFRDHVLMGHQLQLERPVLLVSDPYANARSAGKLQAWRIMANMFGFRDETEVLLHQGAVQYVYHAGLGNKQGILLDDVDAIAQSLGNSAYFFARDWTAIKGALCDGIDNNIVAGLEYPGEDTLEKLFPKFFDDDQPVQKAGEEGSP